VKTHTLLARDRRALTVALKPSAVDENIINFSALSLAFRSLGQDSPNQTRKAWALLTLILLMRVLLGRCPAGVQVLTTWALEVLLCYCDENGVWLMLMELILMRERGRERVAVRESGC
jgi:hypothetical protein